MWLKIIVANLQSDHKNIGELIEESEGVVKIDYIIPYLNSDNQVAGL